MLKPYDKLEDVPEALREHYELSGGKYIPKVSDDHPLVVNNRQLLKEKGEAETKAADLQTKLDSAGANALPRGTVPVPRAEHELLEVVKAAGVTTPDAFKTLQTEHGDYKQKAEEAERVKHAAIVGEAMGWDREKTARLATKVFDFSTLEVRDGEGGKKAVVAKVKGAGDALVEKPFADVVKTTPELSDLVPVLTTKSEWITQADGLPPEPQTREQLVEEQTRGLAASGNYSM